MELHLKPCPIFANAIPSRNMVIKVENPPKLGFEVVDENLVFERSKYTGLFTNFSGSLRVVLITA